MKIRLTITLISLTSCIRRLNLLSFRCNLAECSVSLRPEYDETIKLQPTGGSNRITVGQIVTGLPSLRTFRELYFPANDQNMKSGLRKSNSYSESSLDTLQYLLWFRTKIGFEESIPFTSEYKEHYSALIPSDAIARFEHEDEGWNLYIERNNEIPNRLSYRCIDSNCILRFVESSQAEFQTRKEYPSGTILDLNSEVSFSRTSSVVFAKNLESLAKGSKTNGRIDLNTYDFNYLVVREGSTLLVSPKTFG